MNLKEQAIATTLLSNVERADGDKLYDAIQVYQRFLETVQTRLNIEAQHIENEKNR